MEFGIFDHLDRNALALGAFYEGRLRLAELYDRAGFYCYHIAEHHGTPLGLAPSPGVFLAAVAQRTKQLRMGPLVYTLPLYHPLRLVEEICMLDQLSGGRYQVGLGRGISPVETGFYGVASEERQALFEEVLDIMRQALTQERLTFTGKYYRFADVPIELAPLQQPHPPFWLGVTSADAAERAARAGCNMVCVATAEEIRSFTDRYRAVWQAQAAGRALPRLGLSRFVIMAETDEEALALARRVYPKWHASFYYLFAKHGASPALERAPEFDQIKDGGRGIAGSPETVTRMLRQQLAAAGANYFVGQFAFGDLSQDEAERSIGLFSRHVMPALREALPQTA